MSIDTGSLLKVEDNHHDDHGHSHDHHDRKEKKDTHSNFKAKYSISCESGFSPKSIEFFLFKHFKNLNTLNVKWVSENKQGSKRLKANNSVVGF